MKLESLRDLGAHVETLFPTINQGGCGVYAALVGRKLAKHGVDAWVCVSSWNAPRSLDKYDLDCDCHMDCGLFISHAVLHFEHGGVVYMHDSRYTGETGTHDPTCKAPFLDGQLDLMHIERWAFDSDAGWNSAFNRANIPTLRKIIENWELD